MVKRLAVIDLGSNTFHLLVVDLDASNKFKEVFRLRKFVFLSEGGILNISKEKFDFGLQVIKTFHQHCIELKVQKIHCIGTAILRSASNGLEFITQVRNLTKINIECIDGLREADLIFQGLSLSNLPSQASFILDVGGGSIELMTTVNNQRLFSKSYNIGMSVLRSKWTRKDPPNLEDLIEAQRLIDEVLIADKEALFDFEPMYLIGSSGPFEILESFAELKATASGNLLIREWVLEQIEQVLSLDLTHRVALPRMPKTRGDLSLEAFVIMRYILLRLPSIHHIFISPFSLKEGVISEYLG